MMIRPSFSDFPFFIFCKSNPRQLTFDQKKGNIEFPSLPTDLFTYSNVKGLPNSLKNDLRCERVGMEKSLNSTEYLASEVFGFPASLNSPNIFCLTRRTIYSPFT